MIRNIDWNMGKLMKFLEDENLAKDTILIFKTDNGSLLGPQYFNAGMRGKKTEIWEGGHRVPCFIRWPNGGFGKARDVGGLTQVQDLLPTLLDLCGIKPSKNTKFDGMSLATVLQGKEQVPEDRTLIINYSRMPGFSITRHLILRLRCGPTRQRFSGNAGVCLKIVNSMTWHPIPCSRKMLWISILKWWRKCVAIILLVGWGEALSQ